NVIANTQNWCCYMTLWEPVLGSKENFAIWTNAQNSLYAYICWDTDAQAIVNGATEPFGVISKNNQYNGLACLSGDPAAAIAAGTTLAVLLPQLAAFVLG